MVERFLVNRVKIISSKTFREIGVLQSGLHTVVFGTVIPTLNQASAYLMKYISKSGERIVYSKGTATYFISDIMDDDVVCTIGQEDKKLLLFDDFSCFDEGVYIGEVSRETIKQMRKVN